MPTKDGVRKSQYQALAEVRYQIRRFLNFSEQAARSAGLEPQQHQLLLALKGLPAGKRPTIGDLAERLQIQHHSAVELVDRLERRRLVRRSRGDVDHRQVFVRITRRGETMLRRLSLPHLAELRSTAPGLVHALNALLAEMTPPARAKRLASGTQATAEKS